MASDTRAPAKREKVVLKKGFHLMDWMRLVQSSFDLSGRKGSGPLQVTTQELRLHNKESDCWTVYNGKVYNLTAYMPYHPGGAAILMEGAGKDSTRLFNKYHAWVNCESIIGKCCVGVFVGNAKGQAAAVSNAEDERVETSGAGDDLVVAKAEAVQVVAVESVFTGLAISAASSTAADAPVQADDHCVEDEAPAAPAAAEEAATDGASVERNNKSEDSSPNCRNS
jgi:cytochrome b involved in lipid metabolism